MWKYFLLNKVVNDKASLSANTQPSTDFENGRTELDTLIVGSTVTTIGRFPWQSSLRIDGKHRCGASIISNNRAITAAHCLKPEKESVEQFTVLAGSTFRLGDNGSWIIELYKFIQHPNFDSATLVNGTPKVIYITFCQLKITRRTWECEEFSTVLYLLMKREYRYAFRKAYAFH